VKRFRFGLSRRTSRPTSCNVAAWRLIVLSDIPLRRNVSVAFDANTVWWLRFGARHESIASNVEMTDALSPRRGAACRSVAMTMWRSGMELSADNISLFRSPVGAVACVNAMFFHDNLM